MKELGQVLPYRLKNNNNEQEINHIRACRIAMKIFEITHVHAEYSWDCCTAVVDIGIGNALECKVHHSM